MRDFDISFILLAFKFSYYKEYKSYLSTNNDVVPMMMYYVLSSQNISDKTIFADCYLYQKCDS